jgi:CheY-like chemotaxis protein
MMGEVSSKPEGAGPFVLSPNLSLVIVDDNPVDVRFAQICVRRSKPRSPLLSFSSGEPFLEFLRAVRAGEHSMPGLVLLDINLPGLNGHEILAKVRADPFFDDLPVFVMLTSSTDPRDREKAAARGVVGFVAKSDDPNTFVEFFNSLAGPG